MVYMISFTSAMHAVLSKRKKHFHNTYLLVGCVNDETATKYKRAPILTEAERYESLRHCRWVDEVIKDAPWVVTTEFIDKHRINYVAHDSLPYEDVSGAGNDVYEFVKAAGKFIETKRTDGVSTTDINLRILNDFCQFVNSSSDGTRISDDLYLSYLKEKKLKKEEKKNRRNGETFPLEKELENLQFQ